MVHELGRVASAGATQALACLHVGACVLSYPSSAFSICFVYQLFGTVCGSYSFGPIIPTTVEAYWSDSHNVVQTLLRRLAMRPLNISVRQDKRTTLSRRRAVLLTGHVGGLARNHTHIMSEERNCCKESSHKVSKNAVQMREKDTVLQFSSGHSPAPCQCCSAMPPCTALYIQTQRHTIWLDFLMPCQHRHAALDLSAAKLLLGQAPHDKN
jgi:hypothetical protein